MSSWSSFKTDRVLGLGSPIVGMPNGGSSSSTKLPPQPLLSPHLSPAFSPMASYSPSYTHHIGEEHDPNTSLTIHPSSPDCTIMPQSHSPVRGARRGGHCIRHLALISGEGEPFYMHPSIPIFLSTVSSIKSLHISWHSLDWTLLPDEQRAALIRLVTLQSLDELEIIASRNFPLDLLRGFSGATLRIAFAGDLISNIFVRSVPQAPPGTQIFANLSLIGQKNVASFMEYFGIQPQVRDALRGLRVLCLTCVDDDNQFEPRRNLDLVRSFLRSLDRSRIRELRVQDERPGPVIGQSPGAQGLASLQDVKSIEGHLRVKQLFTPLQVYGTIREWLTSLLSCLPPSTRLRSLDVTYQVIFPHSFTELDGLMQAMRKLWRELDLYLARGFASLQQVNMGFQLHGVEAHERWMTFNGENQPTELEARGVDCSFWVRGISSGF